MDNLHIHVYPWHMPPNLGFARLGRGDTVSSTLQIPSGSLTLAFHRRQTYLETEWSKLDTIKKIHIGLQSWMETGSAKSTGINTALHFWSFGDIQEKQWRLWETSENFTPGTFPMVPGLFTYSNAQATMKTPLPTHRSSWLSPELEAGN